MEQNQDVGTSDAPILLLYKVLPIAEALSDLLRIATLYLNAEHSPTALKRHPSLGNGADPPPPPSRSHRIVAPVGVGPIIHDKEYTPAQAAQILKVALVTIRKKLSREDIRSIKRGTRVFILGKELLEQKIKMGMGEEDSTEDSALTQ